MDIKMDEQVNGREQNPEGNSYIYGHLIFDKGKNEIQQRKDNIFNKWCWNNWKSIG